MANDGPVIRPTQFEADNIGRLAKSVNMSRGDVNLLKTLVSLPGRPGDATLAVSVGIQYGSNVFQQATRWNLDAPTGVLGLGWTLPGNKIALRPGESLAKGAVSYVAEIDGNLNALVEDDATWVRATIDLNVAKAITAGTVPASLVSALADHGIALASSAQASASNDGWTITDNDLEHVLEIAIGNTAADVRDGGVAYQLQSFQFWRISYYEQFERWEITTDTGEVRVFGGGGSTRGQSAGNSIAWGVKWGGPGGADLGPSMDTSSQAQYAHEWNLSSRSDRWGSTVRYGYNEFAREDGLLGRNVEQRVGKDGLPYTKAVYPTSITDLFGRTITFQYGDKTFTSSVQEYMDPHKSLDPATAPGTPPSNLGTPNAYQDRYETLFLDSVTMSNERGELLYTLNCAYDGPVAVSTLTGPLATTGAKRYLSAITETNAFGQKLPCYAFDYGRDPTVSPNLGAMSTITYPQGAAAEIVYQASSLPVCKRAITIEPPEAVGRGAVPYVFHGDDYVVSLWVSQDQYTVTLDVYSWVGQWARWTAGAIYQSASVSVQAPIQVVTTNASFALSFVTSSGDSEVFLVSRDRNISTEWKAETPVTIAGDQEIGLSVGSNFVLVTSDASLYVFTWDWTKSAWVGLKDAPTKFPHPVFAIAADEYYVTATSDGAETAVAISWLDALAGWHAGVPVTLKSNPGHNPGRAMVWDVASGTLAMAFADDPNGVSYTVQLVTWDAGYALSAVAFPGLRGQAVDVGHISWPPQPIVASPRFVGVRQHLFRLDPDTWKYERCPAASSGGQNPWLAYAYGPDVAVQVMNTGSDAVTSVTAYDPTSAGFVSTEITTDLPPGETSLLGWPSVSGDYLIARNALFFRGDSTDWSSAVDAPVKTTLPGSSNGQPVDSRSFVNGGPDYLAYLNANTNPSDNAVQLLVLRNGAVYDLPQPVANTSYTIPVSAKPGQMPLGPGSFVTYPASAESFGAAPNFQLYRYAGDALSGPITTYPVKKLMVRDGFGSTCDTAYDFDGMTAACDPSGEIVKYFRSTSYAGAAEPATGAFGRTVYSYENGYALGSKYSMLDGLLLQTVAFSGAFVFQTGWQDAFGLDYGPAPQVVTQQLRSAFTTGGVQLSSGAVVSYQHIDQVYEYWLVADAAAAYMLEVTSRTDPAGVLRVFDGSPVQSVSNVWEVFTSRVNRPLYGGYPRPTTNVTRKDGVPVATVYGYDDLTGLPATKTWTISNATGAAETHTEESVYGAAVYPAMAAANLLAPVVSARHTVTVGGVTKTSSSSGTTWTGWRPSSGPGLTVQAAAENWGWIGDPTGADTGVFPFDEAPGPTWRRLSAVTQVSDAGLTLESVDAASMVHSTVYDPAGQVQIASLSNGSFAAGQACYEGFEEYEDAARWTLSGGAEVAAGNAHTGSSSLRLPAGAAAKLAPLTPDGGRSSIFSAWVCTSSDFVAGSGHGWSLTLESGDLVPLPFEATQGSWSYQSVVVPATGSLSVAVANGSGTVRVDDVMFVPMTAEYSARVYDSVFRLPSAQLDEAGHTSRTYRDSFMREIGGSTATDIASSLELKYYSATENSGGFSPADPNASIAVKAFVDGSYASATDWSIEPAGAISYAAGSFVHDSTALSAMLSWARPALAAFALYFETLPVGAGPLALTDDFSIQAGATTFTLSAATGQWSIGSGGFVGHLRSCLLVQVGDQLMFWANGKLIGSVPSAGQVQPSIVTGKNAVSLANLILLDTPAVRVVYSDATGAERQDHAVTAEEYVLHHTISDARSEVIVTTKSAPGLFGSGAGFPVPAYRPGFVDVTAFLASMDQTGVMTGDVADWYDGTNDTDDAGYPYTRVALEPSPLARPLEYGFAGAKHAIVDFESTSPSERTTPQLSYGVNARSTIPYLDLPADSYGTVSRVSPSKIETIGVSDATSGSVGRYTPTTGFFSSVATTFADGEQTVSTEQPNGFAPGQGAEVELRTKNALQQLTGESSPDGGASRYLYDSAGRIRFFQDASGAAAGILVYFRWDALGRMIARGVAEYDWSPANLPQLQAFADDGAWPENQNQAGYTQQRSWTWDGDGSDATEIGQLVERRAATGSTVVTEALTWDGDGRLVVREMAIDDGVSTRQFTTTFAYDLRGRLRFVTYPAVSGLDFTSVHYVFDGRDNLRSITDDQGVPFVEYTYNAQGAPTGTRFANGDVAGTRAYDSTGRETVVQLTSAQSSYESTLGYDVDGLVASLSETLQPTLGAFDADVEYHYDGFGRLQSATDTKGPRSVTLDFKTRTGDVDRNGNIQAITDGTGVTTSLEYTPGTNQVKAQTAGGSTSACAYTPTGALRQRGSELTIDYVPGTMLPSAVTASEEAMSFAYDANGYCVARQSVGDPAAVDVHAGFDGPIVIVDPDGTCRALVYGARGPVAMCSGSKRYSVLTDMLRSPRIVWDASGDVVAAYAYSAFGARTATKEPAPGFMPLGLTGQRFLPASGLYDFRTRLYDPAIGRFLSPDPVGQFPSSYCYAGNLPTLLTDPTGQSITPLGEAALDTVFLLLLVAAVVGTGGWAAAVIPEVAAASAGTAILYGAGIGAIGGAVSNISFQALMYDLTTPPGEWDGAEFGKELLAAGIAGAVGGAITGGIDAPFMAPAQAAAADTATSAARAAETDLASADRPILMDDPDASLVDRSPRPDPAQAPAQSAFAKKFVVIGRGTLTGAIGGGTRGYLQTGLTNVMDGRDWSQDQLYYTARGLGGGAFFGVVGGVNSAFNLGGRAATAIATAFEDDPKVLAWAVLGTPPSLLATLVGFSWWTSTLRPSTPATVNQQAT